MNRAQATWFCTCKSAKGNGREISYPSGDYLECGICHKAIRKSRLQHKQWQPEHDPWPTGEEEHK